VSPAAPSNKVVLIAEDYPDISQLVSDLLRDEGYYIVAVSRGGEVIPAVRQYHPSVVLLDLALPDIPGNEVLERLSTSPETNLIPVIIISAYSERLRRVPQVVAVVNKPFEIDTLLNAVAQATAIRPQAA